MARAARSNRLSDEERVYPLRRLVIELHEWMLGPKSERYYESLTPDEKQRFNDYIKRLGTLRTRIVDLDAAALAYRADIQMDLIQPALDDARQRLESQRRRADTLEAFGTFIDLVTDLLL